MGALLPHARVRDVNDKADAIRLPQIIAFTIVNIDTGQKMTVGGRWYPVAKRLKPLTKYQKSKLRKIRVHSKQWELVKHCLDALENHKFKARGMQYIQEILTGGGRQTGKSYGTSVAGAACMVAKPGTHIAVVAPRKDGAVRLVGIIKRVLPKKNWDWKDREGVLTLMNHSKMWARSSTQFETLRGPAYNAIFLDEACLMQWKVRAALTGNLLTKNGFFVYMTTPRGHDWVYLVYKKQFAGYDNPTEEDIKLRETVRVVSATIFDNTFLSDDARERALQEALSLSEHEYDQEILGKFIPEQGKAFPAFNRDNNVVEPDQMAAWGIDDITRDVCMYEWGIDGHLILGIDLNYAPNSCTFNLIGSNGSIWQIDELQFDGNVEDFCRTILEKLDRMGYGEPAEAVRKVACVIDASAYWQGTGKKYTKTEAAKTFEEFNFKITPPIAGKRFNPDRFDRFQVTSRMILNKAGEVRLFVSSKCVKTIEMYEEIPILVSVPDHKWKNAHIYDAGSYPIYRLFAKEHIHRIQPFFKRRAA